LINNVRKTVVKLAQEVGKSEGYMLIFEKQSGAVLFAKDSLEITDRFVEDMDEHNEPVKK
jgi:Skp family chaperone for outer membrane proteins